MKTFIVTLCSLAAVCSCGKATKTAERPILGFNGFPWGAPADSIINVIGFSPDKRANDILDYKDVRYEGVLVDEVKYLIPGGKLKSGTAFKLKALPSATDSLIATFTARYGKPTKQGNDVTSWAIEDTQISVISNNRTIMVVATKQSHHQ